VAILFDDITESKSMEKSLREGEGKAGGEGEVRTMGLE
jgi:hypothetical protein